MSARDSEESKPSQNLTVDKPFESNLERARDKLAEVDLVELERTDDPWQADIVIEVKRLPEDSDIVTSFATTGRDFDNDGAYEYYTRAVVTIGATGSSEAWDWYIGWRLASILTGDPGDELPEPLRSSATYEERRSDWWKEEDEP